MKRTEKILKEVLEKSNPSEEDLKKIKEKVNAFSSELNKNLKRLKIDAEIFVGGSFAKATVIKKDKYDVDVFVRYDKKYKDKELSSLTEKLLGKSEKISVVHGSRDYFRVNYGENFFMEIIPVKKITNTKEYENITDLSYLHVNYINKKIKSKKILDEIKIAKAFCYANGCYGAESYIHGFSGYSLELLIYYYKGFEKFIKAMTKVGKEKLIIDIEKQFKNKKDALIDLNSSKLNSPVILIDPTHKHRNVLAALSQETFEKFQKACRNFIKNPSIKSFEIKKPNIEKLIEKSLKKRAEFAVIEIETNKPEGDIAGSKLLKFNNYLKKEISRFFNIKKSEFNYNQEKSAKLFFLAEKKNEIIYSGPFSEDKNHLENFRKEHKNIYEKNKRFYAKENFNLSLKEFIDKWKSKNSNIIKQMYITNLIIIQ
jgi:tRNA CCA-adding enzyme